MTKAGMRGRPIARLVLSGEERSYLRGKFVVTELPDRCLSGAASFCDARMACRASMWQLNSASTNTPLASGVADF
jgi:hypothetical protein